MVKTREKLSLSGSAGTGWLSCRLSDQFGLLARIPFTNVPEKWKAPDIPWQVGFAETTKHPQIGLQEGKQALGSLIMHLSAGVLFLRIIDVLVERALQGPIAARRVRIEPTAHVHRQVGGLLHRLHRAI